MQYEREKYLQYLEQYLRYANFEIKKDGQMRCPNNAVHTNGDKDFSAKYYPNDSRGHPRVECFACGFKADIYDVAGFIHNEKDFNKQYELIDDLYGRGEFKEQQQKKVDDKKKIVKSIPISVNNNEFKGIYSDNKINKCRSYSKNEIIKSGKLTGYWKYSDSDNNIIACDVRIDDENGKKKVVTFWYNGKNLKFTGDVFVIYNLYNSINSDKPILIHEGAKCAELGINNLPGFDNVSYNRGAENAGKPDWSIFKNRIVYILQDNDRGGMVAAKTLKTKLPQAIILKTIFSKFEIEDKEKSDIEQLLEQTTPQEIENFILTYDENEQSEFIKNKKPVVLGIDDNNELFFIDRFQRLFSVKRNQINKNNMLVISNHEYWDMNYANDKGMIKWDWATDDILEESSNKEFDSCKIRGRGAWKENGNIIYHDGKTTQGNITGEFMYIRKNKRDIGINDTPADFDTVDKLREICRNISFETEADVVKLLGWTLISPFCGALTWRPALLLTGPTASGKSTVLEKIVVPISRSLHLNTHQTSVAGIRAYVGNDSCAISLEEAEANQSTGGFDKNAHRNNLFGLMRSSSSDDAPEGVKSNSEQQLVKYSMKNMFLFVSITPTIADVADDNRIFKVNFIKPENMKATKKWEEIETSLIALLDNKTCRSIRALVWSNLEKIIKDSALISGVMKYEFKKSSRIAAGESIMISAYLNIFKKQEINKENVVKFLTLYYKEAGENEERDEIDELLKKIFDEIIEIDIEKSRKKMSIKECLDCLNSDDYSFFHTDIFHDNPTMREKEENKISNHAEKELKRILGHYGLAFQRDRTLAISNNNDKIKKILNKEDGYNKLFQRHKNFVLQENGKPDKPVSINKQTQRAIIINIYKDEKIIDEDVENIPF